MPASTDARIALSLAWLRGDEYRQLVETFGSADEIVGQSVARLEEAGLGKEKSRRLATPDSAELESARRWLAADEHDILLLGEPDYPALLADIGDPPVVLYVIGDPARLSLPAIAVVGSRNPTRGGLANAGDFSRHLCERGFAIVSGLAEGIDAAAHEAALDAGAVTVAVMGTGADRVYPARHRDLAHRVAAAGAIVAEYPLGTSPRKQHFPERNRLISGLSLGTLVIEAARRSGSLITARLSAEQGREVFAIPGSIHNALARGCHRLIRDGAKLVETGEDIVAELGPLVRQMAAHDIHPEPEEGPAAGLTEDQRVLLNSLGYDPVSVDDLLANTALNSRLTIAELSSMLLILELEGYIEQLAGGRYARCKDSR